MIAFFHHRGWHYLLLVGMGGLLFFLNLGGATLWDVDEGRNADCALEMMRADNWIVPTFNGQLRVDKPALLYWLQIFAYSHFGVNEFAARFPSALAALLTVLAVYELARSMFTRTTGLFAGVVVVASPMMCGAARFANPDALLNCFSVLTLAVFWIGLAERRWWWFVLLGAFSGLAVLAKGPVGLVLPTAVNFCFLLWERRLGILWDRRWMLTSTAFVLTALPWYVWVSLETHGEFLSGFLWRHNVERGMTAMDLHVGFPGFYLLVLLGGAAPWSIFIFVAAWFGFWSAIRCPWVLFQNWWSQASEVGAAEADDRATDRPAAYRLLLCWIAVYVLFFSMAATKLPNYVLPAMAPCAILIARVMQRWRTGSIHLPAWFQIAAVVSLALIGVAVSMVLALAGNGGGGRIFEGRHVVGLEYWALLGLVPILAATAGAWFMRQRQFSRFIFALALTAVLLLAPLSAFASAMFNRYKAPRTLVEQAAALQHDSDIRIGCVYMEHLPSLNFYVQRNIEHLEEEKDVVRFLGYGVPVYLFLPTEAWHLFESRHPGSARVVGRQYDLYHDAEFVVVTNR
jgi:4-amino-4-deoxy-L-arabinose transferase-like glycosyltransferase